MPFLQTFLGSFCSPARYQSVRRMAKGYGLGYSAMLAAFITLTVSIWAIGTIHNNLFIGHDGAEPLFEDVIHQIAKQVPIMTLDKGHLIPQHPRPTQIVLTFDRAEFPGRYILATIDTTGATTVENMKTPFLITSTQVIFYNRSKQEKKIHDLSEYTSDVRGPLIINRALAESTAEHLISYTRSHLPLFYFMFLTIVGSIVGLIYYVLRVVMVFGLGAGGMLIAHLVMRKPVSYAACVRLAAMSYTPVAILTMISFMLTSRFMNTLPLLICGMVMLSAALVISRDELLAETA